MICYNTPPKMPEAEGVVFQLSVQLVYGKQDDGTWIFDCICASNISEHNIGVTIAEWLHTDGTLEEIRCYLDRLTTKEALENNRSTVYAFFDYITKEFHLSVSFQKDRVGELERGNYTFLDKPIIGKR